MRIQNLLHRALNKHLVAGALVALAFFPIKAPATNFPEHRPEFSEYCEDMELDDAEAFNLELDQAVQMDKASDDNIQRAEIVIIAYMRKNSCNMDF